MASFLLLVLFGTFGVVQNSKEMIECGNYPNAVPATNILFNSNTVCCSFHYDSITIPVYAVSFQFDVGFSQNGTVFENVQKPMVFFHVFPILGGLTQWYIHIHSLSSHSFAFKSKHQSEE